MPSTKARFACGHRGFGAGCHRCADADRLLEKSSKAKDPTEAAHLKAEAARLKAPAVKKTVMVTSAPVETEAPS